MNEQHNLIHEWVSLKIAAMSAIESAEKARKRMIDSLVADGLDRVDTPLGRLTLTLNGMLPEGYAPHFKPRNESGYRTQLIEEEV